MSPLFDDEQDLAERMLELGSRGFPVDDCIQLATALVRNQRGEMAEGAVRTLVGCFPEEELNRLVLQHVLRGMDPDFDYCEGLGVNVLAEKLLNLGFAPVERGWRVGWPGGQVLEDENLCRLALLAVWFKTMSESEAKPNF